MTTPESESSLAQRQQLIISAAKNCFSRAGFHGASMADISRESGLGAGQIYRYFSSKALIINETIKSIAAGWRQFLVTHLSGVTGTANIIDTGSAFWQDWSFQERCLLLEMYSEASRNESARRILENEEQQLVEELTRRFQQKMPEESEQQRHDRIQFLLMLVDGVACRAFGNQDVDPQELTRINGILSRHLFP